MDIQRRDFVKKGALAASVGAAAVTTSALANSSSVKNNGVVVGESPKKEILYTKTKAWEEYYKQAR